MVGNHKKESLLQGVINQVHIHGVSFFSIASVCAILEVILCIIFGVLNKVAKDNEALGLILFGISILIVAICTLITSIIMFSFHYNMGIKMSRTRNELMMQLGVFTMLFHIVLLGLTFLISRVAVWIYSTYNPVSWGIEEIPISVWLAIVLGPVIVGVFAGGVVSRFGKKGGGILYVFFIGLCIAPSVILNQVEEHTVLNIYLGVEVIGGILALLLVSGIYMLKKAEVR